MNERQSDSEGDWEWGSGMSLINLSEDYMILCSIFKPVINLTEIIDWSHVLIPDKAICCEH